MIEVFKTIEVNEEIALADICRYAEYDKGDAGKLARIIINERKAREANPGAWDSAPEWATNAVIGWSAKTHYSGVYKTYTRELPKTKAREVAEKFANTPTETPTRKYLADTIEQAILEYEKETKGVK